MEAEKAIQKLEERFEDFSELKDCELQLVASDVNQYLSNVKLPEMVQFMNYLRLNLGSKYDKFLKIFTGFKNY
jgi:hypothetical protein